ncbi:hypothetical protein V8D89_015234 [Ganoderma adspersum]
MCLKDVVIETPVFDRPQLYEPWLRDLDDDDEWEMCLAEPFDMIVWISLLADIPEGFKKERKLNERFHRLLEKFFDNARLSPLELRDRGCDTKIDMKGECMTALGFAAIWLVFESKLWNGTGGTPELLAVYAVQRRIMSSRVLDYIRAVTACPCLVMGMSGSEVSWYAVYFTDKTYATRLCKICLEGSARAADAEENRAKFQPDSIISEHRPASTVDELKSLHLIIFDRIPGGKKEFNTHRALFTGTVQRKGESLRKRVYVKFVTSYDKEAHSYLASHDPPLAPQIVFYGEVVSRITMIVMEDLDAIPIHSQSVLENLRLRSLIQPKTEEALNFLHAGGFVHGDIRSPNLLMDPATGCVYIIDFDWAGKQGLARYPTNLNPKVKWIPPALLVLMRNKVILQGDDTFMLQTELSGLLEGDYIKREQDVVLAPVLGKRSSRDEAGDGDGDGDGSDRPGSRRARGEDVVTGCVDG